MCELISKQLNAFTLGIDIMCKDISKPLNNGNGYLIEVNTAPEMYLNLFPQKGLPQNKKGLTYLRALVPKNVQQKCYFYTHNNTGQNDAIVIETLNRRLAPKLPTCIIVNNRMYEMSLNPKTTLMTQINKRNIKSIYNFIKLNKRFAETIIVTNDKKALLEQKFNPILSEINLQNKQ